MLPFDIVEIGGMTKPPPIRRGGDRSTAAWVVEKKLRLVLVECFQFLHESDIEPDECDGYSTLCVECFS